MNFRNFVFWSKNVIFRKDAINQYKDSIENQYKTIKEIEEINWAKRKYMVKYAYENIPFYKKFYDDCGFSPESLKNEQDWENVPILKKEYVRKYNETLINKNLNRKFFTKSTTGGTTGMPLKIYYDNRFKYEILTWRALNWWHVSPADNVGILHRRVGISSIKTFKNRMLWWPTHRAYLNATSINDEEIEAFVKSIKAHKTVWLQGYVGALERVADYVINNNIVINSLKLVWSTSAPLYLNVRIKMEKAFNCKIMDQYGSNEILNIALQCPKSEHLHINYDYVHVETIDENNKIVREKEGNILVTNLTSFVFPLIRYELGDKGCILNEKCSCGVNLPLMKTVKGRISDSLYTPSGLYIDGNYLNSVFDLYYDYIDKFQIVQKKDYSIKVYVVKKNVSGVEDVLNKIKTRLISDVRNEVDVNIEVVDNIKDEKGKIRYIINELDLKK